MDVDAISRKAQEYLAAERDPLFRDQVQGLLERKDFEELNDRFYTDLDFGTGGMRGVIGGGYNRMNSYTVQRATQGLASYINKMGVGDPSAVIAYDSRHFSDVFALEAAKVLCGNGIRTYLFTGLRPTPELSFAVRLLKATAGIVVTASHNPPQYNGYKVYWSDGGQIVSPQDKEIVREVRSVTGILSLDREEAQKQKLLVMIDREVDDSFIDMIARLSLRPRLVKEKGAALTVVYTPLCGAGGMPVERALRSLGIEVTFVDEQRRPNGDFPTLTYPNPEEPSALKLAIELAQERKADLVMATDPDADRLGIAIPDRTGRFVLVTGNQLGVLLLDYILSSHRERGTMPANPAFIKTIVTTELQRVLADDYGVRCFDTLTGFKYIAGKMHEFESEPNGPVFLFGTEESYGFLVEADVRDKDAVGAAVMTAEMTLYHVSKGKSLLDRLNELYAQYGYFEEVQISKHFPGEAGLKTMQGLMDALRTNPPAAFAAQAVVVIKDYLSGTSYSPTTKKIDKDIELPPSNVLQFILSDSTVVTARPSGTEPKIKFYVSCRGAPGRELEHARLTVREKTTAVSQEIDRLISQAVTPE